MPARFGIHLVSASAAWIPQIRVARVPVAFWEFEFAKPKRFSHTRSTFGKTSWDKALSRHLSSLMRARGVQGSNQGIHNL